MGYGGWLRVVWRRYVGIWVPGARNRHYLGSTVQTAIHPIIENYAYSIFDYFLEYVEHVCGFFRCLKGSTVGGVTSYANLNA